MIMVVNYGMGNLCSIDKALKKIGAEFFISNNPADLEKATHIIVPGVGFFGEAMTKLNDLGFVSALKEHVIERKKPILGICLGMQLLFKTSEEGGLVNGLGFVDGDVKQFAFEEKNWKVPHVGWNSITHNGNIDILNETEQESNFYFVHSYHPVLNETIPHTKTNYGYGFVSAFQKDNIFGTQFHPEKSQKKGLKILKKFMQISVMTHV